MWIYGRKILINKLSKTLFISILALFIIPNAVLETDEIDLIYTSKSKVIANYIAENKFLKNSKLYNFNWWSELCPGASMYLEQKNIFIYDLYNRKRNSFESLKNIFHLENEFIDFDEFYNQTEKDSYILEMESLQEYRYINTETHTHINTFAFLKN